MDQDIKIFVSVGGTANPAQEDFIRAVEDRLRSESLSPHTVGRNTFSADARAGELARQGTLAPAARAASKPPGPVAAVLTVGQIVGSLRPAQLWTVILAAAAVVGGAFSLGVRLGGS